ncbi:MAG: TIR domain-containing protein, partial [Acidobacteria bacterium]|nr:TIR domain-containing protein [Acidobacteriota bacterium]
MSSVFISYSSKDRETALKVKAALESHGISVTIDQKDLKGNIAEFIERSVRENEFTLTIISEHSLNSAWVSQEGITTIYGEKFTGEQKYIACYLDEEFLQDDYVVRATAMINADIKRLEKLKKEADRGGANPTNLESKINRLKYHRGNLGDILKRLQGDRTFDIRDQQFESSISQIVEIILPDSFIDIRPLELQYLEQLKKRGIQDQTKYTPLGGRATEIPMIRDSFDLRPCESINIGKIGGGRLEPRRFEDAVGEILALKRAVVLGEPGAGKSTTLWKLVGDLREKARLDRSAPIPMFIALGKWTAEDEGFAQFLCRELGELGKHLDRLLRENRAYLFLDGLNELPAAQRKEKTKQIRSFIEREELSDLTAIISCRQLDYTENDLEMHRVEIVPLDPIRVKEFIYRYLGEGRGEALFWRLAGPDAEKAFRQFR